MSVLAIGLLHGGSLLAQCNRIGQVSSLTPGCGAVIKDVDNGQSFHAVGANTETLVEGKTILFETSTEPVTDYCPQNGLPSWSLSCWTETQITDASFSYTVDPDNSLRYTFQSNVAYILPQLCLWTLEDGPNAVVLIDNVVEYTFAAPGLHKVCLKIIDNSGILAESCQNIPVTVPASGPCGYDTYVTAVGTQLFAKLLPLANPAGDLSSVIWTNGNNGTVLGDNAGLFIDLPGYGEYTICAEYSVKDTNNVVCSGSICKPLVVSEPGCTDPQLTAAAQICPDSLEDVPVCGCDGLTYPNECAAMAAGVNTWWAGNCDQMFGSCVADVDMKIVEGNPDTTYKVLFTNLSSGNSNMCHFDFGDGSPIWETTQWESITHEYPLGGVYRINVSVWKQNACASSVTKLLVTDASNLITTNLPATPDYVLPGDANGDKKANVYDLLDIGLGYMASGAPRPNASNEWVPQYAPNWPEHLPETLNFKHLDCDGDGMVLDLDVDLIEPHYSAIDNSEVSTIPNAPEVWVEFLEDTITVDANDPTPLEINAKVMVGSPEAPALGLHGLAFALKYPDYVEHDPVVDYKNDFFGISNHILWLSKDNYAERQLDLGFTKKYSSSSGYGQIATITFRSDFIIIIDIIEREVGDIKAFAVPVRGLKAIDENGHVIEFGTRAAQDTLWIKLLETSGTNENTLDRQIKVYPNPATDEVRILNGDLEIEHLEAVNALGQVVYSAAATSGRSQRLQVAAWPMGLYTLRLRTAQGLAEKKLMVH